MLAFWSLFCNAVLLSGLSTMVRAGTIDCNDEEGCSHDNMIDSYVNCRGYRACHDSSIDASYTISSGDLSNSYSDIESYYTYNYGRYSSYFSTISTIFIENVGYYSGSYSDIKPLSNILYGYFYGYYSGYYSDVSCYDGNTCKIYCNNGGCEKLHFYCYANSICYYDCSSDTSYCPTLYASDLSEITYNIGNNDNLNKYTGLTDDAIKEYYNQHKIAKGEESVIIPDISDKFKENENKLLFDNVQDAEEAIIKEITESEETKNTKNNKNTRNVKNVARVFAVDAELSGDLIGGLATPQKSNNNKNKKKGGFLSDIKWTQYMVACIIDLLIFMLLFKAFTYIKNKRNVELIADLDERQQRAQIIDEEHYDLDYQSTQHQYYYDPSNNNNNNNNNYYNNSINSINSNNSIHEQEAPIRHNEYSPLVDQFY